MQSRGKWQQKAITMIEVLEIHIMQIHVTAEAEEDEHEHMFILDVKNFFILGLKVD